jgi:anti-sigma regulatory factor (Ser/Thr protein kinase)
MAEAGRWRRDFPVTVAETVATARWLDTIAAEQALPGETAYAMQICLEELLGNVLRHGGDDRHASVSVEIDPNRLAMTVEDDGRPFDVASAPVKHVQGSLEDLEPGGLGIGLVHDFSDRLEYSRAGLGNRVTVTFSLSNPTSSPAPGQ